MYSIKSLDYASRFPAERKQLRQVEGGGGRKGEKEEGRKKDLKNLEFKK